ncbi:MAG: hypothetical protein IMW89_15785 [Ktedonobacteraceae bacterium]|nr:hypothetical protein [Ktedonobacteraceae bacterium]
MPCPHCGATPSQADQASGGSGNWWNGGASWDNGNNGGQGQSAWSQSGAAWGNFSPTGDTRWDQVPQYSFESSTPSFAPPVSDSQSASPANAQNAMHSVEPQRSLIPISPQANAGLSLQSWQQAGGSESSLPVLSTPSLEQLLPALPEESTYVPPMYTKPRPVTPPYRIISGLLSVIIVSLLICAGAGYYARTSGLLGNVMRSLSGAPPASLAMKNARPPDPPDKIDKGPAYDHIPSAATASRINKETNAPVDQVREFKPGQVIYLTYTVPHPRDKGTVTVKWYTNNSFFTSQTQEFKPSQDTYNAAAEMKYAQPAEGKVELYWNDQLAQTLYFVVR